MQSTTQHPCEGAFEVVTPWGVTRPTVQKSPKLKNSLKLNGGSMVQWDDFKNSFENLMLNIIQNFKGANVQNSPDV
jgi:hypothetical protein